MGTLETGLPATIDRERLMDMLRSLGLDPDLIHPEGIRISAYSVECKMSAIYSDGGPVLGWDGRMLWNLIHIPLDPPYRQS